MNAAKKAARGAKATYRNTHKAFLTANNDRRKAQKVYDDVYRKYYGNLNMYDWGVHYPLCTVVPAGSNEFEECKNICLKGRDGKKNRMCDSVNVVPWKIPGTSSFAGELNPMIPKQCRNMEVPDNARLCYALREGKATDAGSAFTISHDPDGNFESV